VVAPYREVVGLDLACDVEAATAERVHAQYGFTLLDLFDPLIELRQKGL
jgi:hypothetical protein